MAAARTYQHIPPPPPVPSFSHQAPRPDVQISQPHFEQPLAAPRPQKLDPELPAHMARTLDAQLNAPPNDHYRGPSPGAAYKGVNPSPGFAMPTPGPMDRNPSPLPPPQGSTWSPWNIPQSNSPPSMPASLPPSAAYSQHTDASLAASVSSLSVAHSRTPPRRSSDPSAGPPSLTAPLPTISSLIAGLSTAQNPSAPPTSKLAWARDVLTLAERLYAPQTQSNPSSSPAAPADPPAGPLNITDPEVVRLADIAIPLILQLASTNAPTNQLQPHIAEAIYWKASLASSGAYPHHVQPNPRAAFRDFERAARAGYYKAWFRIGRDYEGFNDVAHARDCFERGAKHGDESCLYRMGMAHLMGQLGLQASPETALPLLQRAATLASPKIPQPAYVFALLLLGEFAPAPLPASLLLPLFPSTSGPNPLEQEARKHLERAAFLHFAPAQYKLGHAYEFAQPPFEFDPLLSVQYYSLASQQGEVEADMALSKWFLCGAEGAFDKDESLAFVFAEKAARRGLPSAEFAMGYYLEVGVGGEKNVDVAKKWYTRAAEHGNVDAKERLAALQQPAPHSLSRQEHDTLTETTLVRKRTQAKNRSDARGGPSTSGGRGEGRQQIVAKIRQNSMRIPEEPSISTPPPMPTAAPINPPANGHGLGAPNGRHGRPSIGESGSPRPQHERMPVPAQPQGPPQQGSPHPQPANLAPRAPANQPRYSLTDSGTTPPPPQAQQSGSTTPPQQQRPRPQHNRTGSGTTVIPRPPPGKGPATFQEMGFTSQKLEDKECVIM
ncbi:hypothetical protein OF83DRAFT_1267391 [Amylostereum chailletii]|nr:hypothetical protein OF83DRAFT_1267391 [Amylostereum chailletii]